MSAVINGQGKSLFSKEEKETKAKEYIKLIEKRKRTNRKAAAFLKLKIALRANLPSRARA